MTTLRRNPKSDGQPVVGVHQADRDRQIGLQNRFTLREGGWHIVSVGNIDEGNLTSTALSLWAAKKG
jgi:hypothetical protein